MSAFPRRISRRVSRPSHVNHQCQSDQIRIYSLVNLSKYRLRSLQIYINSSREEQRFAPLCMDKALKIERPEPATQSLDGCLDGLLNTLSWASYTLPARNWTRMTQISLRWSGAWQNYTSTNYRTLSSRNPGSMGRRSGTFGIQEIASARSEGRDKRWRSSCYNFFPPGLLHPQHRQKSSKSSMPMSNASIASPSM